MLLQNLQNIFQHRLRYQILAALTVHLMTLSHGIAIGWLSPTLKDLKSAETPLSFSINVTEASWIGSSLGLGAVFGNIITCFVLNRLGRKWCLYFAAIPHMGLWILVYFAHTAVYLYIARFLAGITCGFMYITTPIYLSEILSASVRGALSSLMMLFLSFGIFIGYLISSHMDYHLIPCLVIGLSVIYLIAMPFFPETPQYLLKSALVDAAEKSYKFYNQPQNAKDDQKVYEDFNALRDSILLGTQNNNEFSKQDFYNKKALQSFLTGFMICLLSQFSGSFAFINYMSLIFAESTTTMDANMCAIITAVVQIAGTCAASMLVERFGRKLLILISTLGMALGMLAFGAFTKFASTVTVTHYNWLPLALMAFVIFMASIGVLALTFTLLVEILPAKIRSKVLPIFITVLSILAFIAFKIYPYFIYNLGIPFTMFFNAGVCICCAIYMFILLPETKGKSMDHD